MIITQEIPPDLTIVVLAFNEGKNIAQVLDRTLSVMNARGQSYEILVVNDGSADETGRIAADYAAREKLVRVVHHDRNRGYGAGMRTGIMHAKGDFVSFIPADGEIHVDEAIKLRALADSADLVVSSRRPIDAISASLARPWWRATISFGLRILSWAALGFDPSGKEGILLVRRNALDAENIHSDTGLAHLEVMMRVLSRGGKMAKGEIVYGSRLSGQSKVANSRTLVRYLIELGKLRWKTIR